MLINAVAPFAGAWIEITAASFKFPKKVVAPLAGAWIEIMFGGRKRCNVAVAPLAGAWIEIASDCITSSNALSLPSRERGLKSKL